MMKQTSSGRDGDAGEEAEHAITVKTMDLSPNPWLRLRVMQG
jgi:hypothetical protein